VGGDAPAAYEVKLRKEAELSAKAHGLSVGSPSPVPAEPKATDTGERRPLAALSTLGWSASRTKESRRPTMPIAWHWGILRNPASVRL
jgi:hypothetical protein